MATTQSFMVTGATGWQGGSLARILLAQRHVVNVLVRDPSSDKACTLAALGARIFHGGFDDLTVIRAAIKGVSGVFYNPFPTPHDPDLQVRQSRQLIQICVDEGCHLFLTTAAFTAHKSTWDTCGPQDFLYLYYSRKHAVEAEVRAAKLKSYTIVRPAYLMHNYLLPFCNFHYPELPTEGVLRHMYDPGVKFTHLNSADVGRIAAVVLLNPDKYDKLEIDLGAEDLDADDVAAVINRVSGRTDISAQRVVMESEFDTVKKKGLTWHYYANMLNPVTVANPGGEIEKLFGLKLTTFEEYSELHKDLLKQTLPVSQG